MFPRTSVEINSVYNAWNDLLIFLTLENFQCAATGACQLAAFSIVVSIFQLK